MRDAWKKVLMEDYASNVMIKFLSTACAWNSAPKAFLMLLDNALSVTQSVSLALILLTTVLLANQI